jgi:Two component regulator propeller
MTCKSSNRFIFRWIWVVYAFFLIVIVGFFFVGPREQPPPLQSIIYRGHVISILQGNRIEALHISGWNLDKKLTSALQKDDPEYLYADSEHLAMVNNRGIYVWIDKELKWNKIEPLPKSKEKILDFFVINRDFFLVYPTKVMNLVFLIKAEKEYYVPELEGQDKDLRSLQAVHVSKKKIWFGTGSGEWGGHLLTLDLETGEWQQIYSPSLYVNAITEDSDGTIWVAWAMSHFLTTSALSSYPTPPKKPVFWQGHYLQVIAYNKYDNHLYGVDRNNIVRIEGDSIEKVADLGEIRYIRGYYSMGIYPLIEDMLIVDKDVFLIPHKWDGLFLYEKGGVRKIQESKSTVYWLKVRFREFMNTGEYLVRRAKITVRRFIRNLFSSEVSSGKTAASLLNPFQIDNSLSN